MPDIGASDIWNTEAPILPELHIKRVYDPASDDDGQRILVDRLWPRGLTKSKARVDLWLRDVAPSATLRIWFDHRVERWEEFRRRYRDELTVGIAVRGLRDRVHEGPVTLLYGAHDQVHNHAVVLAEFLTDAAVRQRSMHPDTER